MIKDLFPFPPNYLCPNPDLSLHGGYDNFIEMLQFKLRIQGRVDIENMVIRCDGQCPNGCEKKFKMKLGKSITKKKYDKMYKHGILYPKHCIQLMYEGTIKHGK